MPGVTLGFLKFVLGFDTIAFKKGMTDAERELVKLQKKVQSFGKGMTQIGKTMSIALTAPLVAFAASGIKEARETADAMGRVNNALSQTGAVAGQTAPKLQAIGNALEAKSLYEADQILSQVTATMLRFGKILPENFAAAQQAAVDFAAATGKDLAGSAVAVGKALQDPIKGAKALKAVGIDLTAQQKAQIAVWQQTGDTAKIQAFVLDQLNSKIKGVAETAQNTDPYNRLSDAYKNAAESIGTLLLPILTSLANDLATVAEGFSKLSPETQKWVGIIGGILAILGPILIVLGTLTTAIANLAPLITALSAAWGILTVAWQASVPVIAEVMVALAPLLIPLAAVAAAITAVYFAVKYWDQIVVFAQKVWAGVKKYFGMLVTILQGVASPVEGAVAAFKAMYDAVVGHSIVPDMIDGIGAQMARLQTVMVQPAQDAAEAATQAFEDMKSAVGSILDRLFPEEAKSNAFIKDLETLTAGMAKLGFSAAQTDEAVRRLISEHLGDISGPAPTEAPTKPFDDILNEGGKAIDDLHLENKKTTEDMAREWGDMAVSAVGSMRDMVASFKQGDILGGIMDVLSAVENLLTSLAKIGVFGKSIPGYGGGRAAGGPVVPGKTYMVGERGPEFISPSRSGYVHPNGAGAQAQRVVVVPSAYFDVVVDHRAANVAAPMAGRAAIVGVTGSEARASRRAKRNLLAA